MTWLIKLAERIENELREYERLLKRLNEAWQKSIRSGDDCYLDSVALNLHAFYGGLERVFELIHASVDGNSLKGANWHQLLLLQMSEELSEIRPAVISEQTRLSLEPYRGFRHIVRHVYTFNFDPLKIKSLVEAAPDTFDLVQKELISFACFLKSKQNADE